LCVSFILLDLNSLFCFWFIITYSIVCSFRVSINHNNIFILLSWSFRWLNDNRLLTILFHSILFHEWSESTCSCCTSLFLRFLHWGKYLLNFCINLFKLLLINLLIFLLFFRFLIFHLNVLVWLWGLLLWHFLFYKNLSDDFDKLIFSNFLQKHLEHWLNMFV